MLCALIRAMHMWVNKRNDDDRGYIQNVNKKTFEIIHTHVYSEQHYIPNKVDSCYA